MNAAGPGRLGPPRQPELVERGSHHTRHVAQLVPRHPRNGVEIDAELVGMIEILGAHRVRMELETGEVGHPQQVRRGAGHDLLRCAARRKLQRGHLDPGGAGLRGALLVEELLPNPVRVAHQHVRASAGAAQRTVGDSQE
jgi:hypothetical protein